MSENSVIIRKFKDTDREAIRKISHDTAFLGEPADLFFDGREILADALTLYFTDYEPDSCFVAVKDSKVVGYIIGTKDTARMRSIFKVKILPGLFYRSIQDKIFLKKKNLRFFLYCIRSFLRGEFFKPDFTKEYPATLHINLLSSARGFGVGKRLLECYFSYLKEHSVSGVHCTTSSESAKDFFIKQGFKILFKSKFSFWNHYIDKTLFFYILGDSLF